MMTLVIMAAGMGSRYGGLKQIDPVGRHGEFILDYSVYDAVKAGFDKVVFIIKRENLDVFRETVGKRLEKVIPVEYAFQEITEVPEGARVPKGPHKTMGNGPCGVELPESGERSLCGNQRGRFLWKRSLHSAARLFYEPAEGYLKISFLHGRLPSQKHSDGKRTRGKRSLYCGRRISDHSYGADQNTTKPRADTVLRGRPGLDRY